METEPNGNPQAKNHEETPWRRAKSTETDLKTHRAANQQPHICRERGGSPKRQKAPTTGMGGARTHEDEEKPNRKRRSRRNKPRTGLNRQSQICGRGTARFRRRQSELQRDGNRTPNRAGPYATTQRRKNTETHQRRDRRTEIGRQGSGQIWPNRQAQICQTTHRRRPRKQGEAAAGQRQRH